MSHVGRFLRVLPPFDMRSGCTLILGLVWVRVRRFRIGHMRFFPGVSLEFAIWVTSDGSVIGLLLVSHGQLAHALLETATEIVGAFRAVESVAISRHEDLDEIEGRLRDAVQRLDHGSGVLILVDMFGGTASNLALRLVGQSRVEVVTGCNLPMLLKLSSLLEESTDLPGLAQLLKFYGQRNVLVASEILKEREK